MNKRLVVLVVLLVLVSSLWIALFVKPPIAAWSDSARHTVRVLKLQLSGKIERDSSTELVESLRQLLKKQDFTQLNEKFEIEAKRFDSGELSEVALDNLIDHVAALDLALEEPIKNWTAQTNFWAANLLAADYFNKLSWAWRGGSFWNRVPDYNKVKFREYQALAGEYTANAKQGNHRDVLWLARQIRFTNQSGGDDERALIERAISQYPKSILIYHSAIHAQQPRWGGDRYYREQLIHDYALLLDGDGYDHNEPTIYLYRALDSAQESDYIEAIRHIKKALALKPHSLLYHQHLARFYYKTKQYDLALDTINITLHFRPDREKNLLLRANILRALKRYDEAIIDLERLLASSPIDREANLKAFSTYAKLGERDKALAALQKAGFFIQYNADEIVRSGSRIYRDLKDLAEAERYLHNAIKLDPLNTGAHYELAALYGEQENCQIVEHIHNYLIGCQLRAGQYKYWCRTSNKKWAYSSVNHLKGHQLCPQINEYDFSNL